MDALVNMARFQIIQNELYVKLTLFWLNIDLVQDTPNSIVYYSTIRN